MRTAMAMTASSSWRSARSASSSAISAPARSTRSARPSPGHHQLRARPGAHHRRLSLMFWSMMIVVTIKYVVDHHARRQQGRGRQPGAARADLAARPASKRWTAGIILLGVFATALFYGDSMITPAMSVLSAVEGLAVVSAGLRRASCCRSSIGILIGLFFDPDAAARRGSGCSSARSCWSISR